MPTYLEKLKVTDKYRVSPDEAPWNDEYADEIIVSEWYDNLKDMMLTSVEEVELNK